MIDAQDALDWLHFNFMVPRDSAPDTPITNLPRPALTYLMDDAAVISRIDRSKQAHKFRQLWAGGAGTDRSGDDLALCSILGFHCRGDWKQVDRLFRQSGLFREKWDKRHFADGRTYGEGTIDKALSNLTAVYSAPNAGSRQNADQIARECQVDREELDQDPKTPTPPSTGIAIVDGKLPVMVGKAQSALINAGTDIFQRSGGLVRPVVLAAPEKIGGTGLCAGSLVILPIDQPWLVNELTTVSKWWRYDIKQGEWKAKNCPKQVAETLLALAGSWRFKVLKGVIEAQTLRPDGSLLTREGYDEKTNLYLRAPGVKPRTHGKPTRQNAEGALSRLTDLLADFPFLAREDLSVALAMILTGLIRMQLPTAPLFGVDAPAAGSGKTLLVDVAALIATGRPAVVLSQGQNDEEFEKRLGSLFLTAPPVINLDNLERPLAGEFLCAALTRSTISIRILGASRSVDIPTGLLFCATGNNLRVSGDMIRRSLVCRLDARVERPEERAFDRDLYNYIPEHRSELIGDCLTILRAYHLESDGKAPGLTAFGSFDEWSRRIRGALTWLDLPDPCQTRTRLEESDPITAELGAVIGAWKDLKPGTVWTARELISLCELNQHSDLRAAFLDVSASRRDPNQIDPRRLGHWLSKINGRFINGLRIEKAGKHHQADLYRLGS